jgi:hypothetical protein
MEAYSLAEFLTLILNRVAHHGGEGRRLSQNPKVLHRAFYELVPKYGEVFPPLRQLHFITAGAFPYSPELTEVLDILQFSGSISRENPSYEQFTPKQYPDTDEWLEEGTTRVTRGNAALSGELEGIVQDLSSALC